MASITTYWRDQDQLFWEKSESFERITRNQGEINRLLKRIDAMSAAKLTVAELRFVYERPQYNRFADAALVDSLFFTDDRVARLRDIASR